MAAELSQVAVMQQKYIEFYQLPVDKKCILIEALQGKNFGYSMQVLAKTLCSKQEFSEYTVYAVCTAGNEEERKDFFRWLGTPNIQTVVYASEEYNRLLATAGVLINENSFQNHFIKKKDQIYIRIWNGVPLQKGGRYSETDFINIGNTQRNLLCADYLVCPNEITGEILADSYMLSNIGKTKLLYAGRFQNEMLFEENAEEKLKKKYGLEGKKVYVYMPTIPGEADTEEREQNENLLWDALCKINHKMKENQVLMLVAPYRLQEKYSFSELNHVMFVPRSCGIIRAFSMAEMFITDCSDMVFDFAVTRKKIVLFSYNGDYEGMKEFYGIHQDLPFAKVKTVRGLMMELNFRKRYNDNQFYENYCKYNRQGMAEAVLRRTLLEETVSGLKEAELPNNGKRNVLIYPGPLLKNGITSSILSLLEHVDREKNNYILLCRIEHIQKVPEVIKQLPEWVSYYSFLRVRGIEPEECELYEKWLLENDCPYDLVKPLLDRRMEREFDRLLSFLKVDVAIHYEGYTIEFLHLLELLPCRRIIYLHNNMLLEIEKKDLRPEPLLRAYSNYDVLALVSEEQRPVAEKMVAMGGGNPESANIVMAKNIIPYEQVLAGAKEPFKLDEETELSTTEEHLRELLASSKKKFVTIGRFLPEKAHDRLITAFEKVHEQYPESCLIILGGYGPLYEQTVEQAQESVAAENIVVIKYMSNPYALLAACDFFVLSSYYEGLPVVLTEADIVGLPCISTNIPGPRELMGRYGGLLTEDSEQGILNGMIKCMKNDAPALFTIDYPEYNKEKVSRFEAMLTEG